MGDVVRWPCQDFWVLSETSDEDIRGILRSAGWAEEDFMLSIYFLGVDYEYRRQGIGRVLLDYIRELGTQLRWVQRVARSGKTRLGAGSGRG